MLATEKPAQAKSAGQQAPSTAITHRSQPAALKRQPQEHIATQSTAGWCVSAVMHAASNVSLGRGWHRIHFVILKCPCSMAATDGVE